MKICIITNPNSGSAEQADSMKELISHRDDIVLWESSGAPHGRELGKRAVDEGFEIVAAAGGDGTVNSVLNGVMASGRQVTFGVVPLGTGNDLARTLALPEDARDAMAMLEVGRRERLDLIKVEADGIETYGLNAAAGGFSGEVGEAISSELKARWGPLAYLIGSLKAVPEVRGHQTFVSFDGEPEEEIDAFNIVVANGRSVAGGKNVAPMANMQDGKLDVVIVHFGTILELANVGARLLAGNYLTSERVEHRMASRVSVRSHPGMWFNVDGEMLTDKPVTFSAVPQALEVIVGTEYTAEPEQPRELPEMEGKT